MFSTQGGIDIEEVAAKSPEKVVSKNVDILEELTVKDVQDLISKLDVTTSLVEPLSQAVYKLYETFWNYSARSAEINPLVLTTDGKIYPADCRIVVDEASVFKHPELEIKYPRDIRRESTELEQLLFILLKFHICREFSL